MKIKTFDTARGVYDFELDNLESEAHAHPAAEIIWTEKGTFTLLANGQKNEGLTRAILLPNVSHQLIATDAILNVIMIECYNPELAAYFEQMEITFKQGVSTFTVPNVKPDWLQNFKTFVQHNALNKAQDTRIQTCLDLLNSGHLVYQDMLTQLANKVHLSESRLTHLFKAEVGISLKKYLVWSKLKRALHLVVHQGISLTEATHQVGFFDQAHMSRAFKTLLGVTASTGYNSQTEVI